MGVSHRYVFVSEVVAIPSTVFQNFFTICPQVFISECVGVHFVGFSLLVLGVASATISFFYGRIVKYIPRIFIGTLAFLINLFFLLFLQFWSREPSFPLIFLFAIGWGISDGIWNTVGSSKLLFSKTTTSLLAQFVYVMDNL